MDDVAVPYTTQTVLSCHRNLIIFKVCKIRFHLYSNIKGACIPKLKAKATETWTVWIHPKISWCGTNFDFICKLIWNHNFPTYKFNLQTLNSTKNRTAGLTSSFVCSLQALDSMQSQQPEGIKGRLINKTMGFQNSSHKIYGVYGELCQKKTKYILAV